MSIYTVKPSKLIGAIAEKLKDYPEISPPEGSEYWKTAHWKEIAPVDTENFWYIRCASILRKILKIGPVGVNRLRKKYGGKNKKGSGLRHSGLASGKIIRVALQQLEGANLLSKTQADGRMITAEGKSILERTAYNLLRERKQD
ncbi:MAG: 30S ribosomal protein S19e [Promethearchaeota archaeon]|nr:MAG: 30S ribosomal protein S19e [Candidatus Lokiarchaeota archaeon]